MYDTPSLFDSMEQDTTMRRVASRRALALAHTRVEQRLGAFLIGASDESEFDARLALVQDDFVHYVNGAAEEVGHNQPEHIAAALIDHFKLAAGIEFKPTPEEDEEDAEKTAAQKTALSLQDIHALETVTEHARAEIPQGAEGGGMIPGNGAGLGLGGPESNAPFDGAYASVRRQSSPFDQSQSLTAPGQPSGTASTPPNGMMQGAPATTPPVPNAATATDPQLGGSAQVAPGQGVNQTQAFPGQLGQPQQQNMLPAQMPQGVFAHWMVSALGDNIPTGPGDVCTTPGCHKVLGYGEKVSGSGKCLDCMKGKPVGQGAPVTYTPKTANDPFRDDPSYGRNSMCRNCGTPTPPHALHNGLCMYCAGQGAPLKQQSVAPPGFQGAASVKTAGECELCSEPVARGDSKVVDGLRLCPDCRGINTSSPSTSHEPQISELERQNRQAAAQDTAEQNDDDSRMVTCPVCGGSDSAGCSKCAGKGKVHNFGGSVLDALDHSAKVVRQWHLAESGNTDLGGPEPVMNKSQGPGKQITPEDNGRWPTKRKDITEPIKAVNDDPLKEIGEKTTETVELDSAPDFYNDSGFAHGGEEFGPHTDTFGNDGQVDPVTSETQTV